MPSPSTTVRAYVALVITTLATTTLLSATAAQGQHADVRRALRVGTGIAVGAALAHALDAPTAWPRTVEGAAMRLADQTGFVALRTLTALGINRAVPWTASREPCPSGFLARARCGLTETLVARTRNGAVRPDVARLGSLALASAGALLWRPERATRRDAGVFVVSRVGSGLLFAALRRSVAGKRKAASD